MWEQIVRRNASELFLFVGVGVFGRVSNCYACAAQCMGLSETEAGEQAVCVSGRGRPLMGQGEGKSVCGEKERGQEREKAS